MSLIGDIASLGLGFCLLAVGAVAVGVGLSRVILVPGELPPTTGLAQRISLYRSVVASVSVALITLPYRQVDGSADSMLGNFNLSILVALVVAAVALAVLWARADEARLDRLRQETGKIVGRILLTAVVGFVMLFYSIAQAHDVQDRDSVLFWFAVFIGGIGFYLASCWFISRHWFGLGSAHPLLPAFVTSVTVPFVSAIELLSGGRDAEIPVWIWLTINFFGVITTLGVCGWEYVEHVAAEQGSNPEWHLAGLTVLVALVLGASSAFIFTGAAEEHLCNGPRPVFNCTGNIAPDPYGPTPAARDLVLTAPAVLDLDTDAPRPVVEAGQVDLYFDNFYALGNRVRPGSAYIALWTGDRVPDRDSCQELLERELVTSRGVAPTPGMTFCVATSGGRLAAVRISGTTYGRLEISAMVWP